MFHPQL
jgi:hypothetical protein